MTTVQSVAISKPAATKAEPAKSAIKARAFPDTAKIVVVSEANPKRPGTKAHAKWALYKGCKTVAEVIAAFVAKGHAKRRALSALRWDEGHGFIEIEGFTVKKPATK